MQHDTKAAALRASTFVPDERAVHYWDIWKFGSRTYSQQLKIPPLQAWDMYVFYKPYILWKEAPPDPTFWMQARNLDIGKEYTQKDLEDELENWLE
jgi:hypothetical protein